MTPDTQSWLSHNLHLVLAGTGNGLAWVQSFTSGNLSAGAVATFCTVVVPLVVGAVIYVIKTAGPVWLKFLSDRDAMRSSTMAGQMERLNRNLESERESGAAKAEIARQLKTIADLATQRADLEAEHNAELAGSVKSLNQKIDEMAARVEDANEKLHVANNALGVATLRAVNAENDARAIQAKLDRALAGIGSTAVTAEGTSAKLDQVDHKVDDLAAATAELAHPSPPTLPPVSP
jgi:hypothetical protein